MKRTRNTFLVSISIALFFAACVESLPQGAHDLVPQNDTAGPTPPSDPVCGDGKCNGLETPTDCIIDCPICGDQICSSGETPDNCYGDCKENSTTPPPEEVCGDGHCTQGENPQLCPADCNTGNQPPVISPPDPNAALKGYVDGVFEKNGGWVVQGWACHVGWGGSVDVELYVGGPANSGTYLKTYFADDSQEPAVGDACGTQEGQHRFFIPLNDATMNAYAGKAVYVHGISPVGGSNPQLSQSGVHHIPGGTPPEDCSACLGGVSSCSESCQGIGYGDGFCKYPGSTDTSVCCECSNSNTTGPGPTGGNTPFNLGDVIWLHVNVSAWPVTTNLNVSVQGPHICFDYGTQNSWPTVQIPHNSGDYMIDVVANPWVFIQHNGQWYAGTWEWFAPGSACKNKTSVAGDHIKQAPFGPMNWRPASGETYYMMVSAPARMGQMTVAERSNIVEVVWP